MKSCTRIIYAIAFATFLSQAALGEEYLLYSPKSLPTAEASNPQDGIVVKSIEVQKGDTLYDLSRKFTGHGMYYPQILLFNSISNPNLIYTGDTLKVPYNRGSDYLSQHNAAPVATKIAKRKNAHKQNLKLKQSPQKTSTKRSTDAPTIELSLSDLEALSNGRKIKKPRKSGSSTSKKKDAVVITLPAESVPKSAVFTPPVPVPPPSAKVNTDGQQLFESAAKAYRKDDCSTALKLLDRYLSEYPGSPLAADASLYRAECYLKLSAQ